MKFKTKISRNEDGKHLIRNTDIVELIDKNSFVETFFFIVNARMPSKNELVFLEALLVSGVEHGIEAPSIYASRVSLASGNATNTALAAGILAMGDSHGGAVEDAMNILNNEKTAESIVTDFISKQKNIPGFGHKLYKDADPRVSALYKKARESEISMLFLDKAREIENELEKQKGKKVVLNIDGAMAAGLLALGMPAKMGKLFFAFARMPGIMAHLLEEGEQGNSYYRLEEGDVSFG